MGKADSSGTEKFDAIVIGGGIAGMVSALNVAEQGFRVFLVDKEPDLGGIAQSIYTTLEGEKVQPFLESLINQIEKHPSITVYTNAELKQVSGYVGSYTSTVALKGEEKSIEIKHGAAIIATGAHEFKTGEYGYGKDRRVLTQHELECELAKEKWTLGPFDPLQDTI